MERVKSSAKFNESGQKVKGLCRLRSLPTVVRSYGRKRCSLAKAMMATVDERSDLEYCKD